MIQMINKLKKNQKGFTLVELIVVLVILAILAAFTIPAMLGFVNDAKAKALVSQTREVYMAYQAALTDTTSGQGYSVTSGSGAGATTTTTFVFKADNTKGNPEVIENPTSLAEKIQKSAMNKLIGDIVDPDGKKTMSSIVYNVTVDGAKVTLVKLTDGNYTITLTPGASGAGSGDTTTEKGNGGLGIS